MNTSHRTRCYFDGLCLDCLNKSQSKLADEHEDYWAHENLREQDYVKGCRVEHRQPTWYYSFMGRKEDKDRFMQKRNPRRFQRDDDWDAEYDSPDEKEEKNERKVGDEAEDGSLHAVRAAQM